MKHTMRYFLLLLSFLAFAQISQAQLLKFGLRAGVSSTDLNADDLFITNADAFQDLKVKAGDARIGIHGGIFARINVPVLPIYIQPELLFSSVGGEYQVTSVVNNVETQTSVKDVNFSRLDIPVLLGTKFGPLRLNAGPIFTFILNEDNGFAAAVREASQITNAEQDNNGATVGYQAGIGIDLFKKLALDIKYEDNLSTLGNGVTIGGNQYNFDTRNSQVVFSLGYFF